LRRLDATELRHGHFYIGSGDKARIDIE